MTAALRVFREELNMRLNCFSLKPVIALMALTVLMGAVWASDPATFDQPLPNGNFEQGLDQWTLEVPSGVSVPSPQISVVNGAARIQRGGAYLAGLTQAFAAPDGLVALRLRLAESPVLTADGRFIPDAFDVQLSSASGLIRTATIRPGAQAAANEAAVPAGFNLGPGVSLVGEVLRIPVDGVSEGELLTFSVSLVGAERDSSSTVAFDDVVMEIQRKRPPPNPNRLNACRFFVDRFDLAPRAAEIPNCWVGQIGDTGQLACLGNGDNSCPVAGRPGQDAEAGRDALAASGELLKLGSGPAGFDYGKLAADGSVLPDAAESWSCVIDYHHGLIWEVKLDDPGSPRHFANSYSWRQSDASINGGAPGALDGGQCVGSVCDTEALLDVVNIEGLCGASDWRIPRREELATLVHSGVSSPAMATDYFPFAAGQWWTWSPSASDTSAAWAVNFDSGGIDLQFKSSALRVRLVREIK
ncbi:MAG: DUF1566 domain-containing protein [Pseudomonadota bacterium]